MWATVNRDTCTTVHVHEWYIHKQSAYTHCLSHYYNIQYMYTNVLPTLTHSAPCNVPLGSVPTLAVQYT